MVSTVDGRNPKANHRLDVWDLVNYGINYQPQTVQDFSHQRYDGCMYNITLNLKKRSKAFGHWYYNWWFDKWSYKTISVDIAPWFLVREQITYKHKNKNMTKQQNIGILWPPPKKTSGFLNIIRQVWICWFIGYMTGQPPPLTFHVFNEKWGFTYSHHHCLLT